jgi:hypothetical protein
MTELFWSFSPWAIFLLGSRVSVWCGIGLGVTAAVVVLVRASARHSVRMLDVASTVYFAGLGLLLAALQPADLDTWGRFAQAGAHASLTLLVFGSVLIGRPFTESYARAQAPESVWRTPEFHAFNRRISLAFGLAFLVGTASLVLAGSTDALQFVLRVGVPFGALLLAFTYTQRLAPARVEEVA